MLTCAGGQLDYYILECASSDIDKGLNGKKLLLSPFCVYDRHINHSVDKYSGWLEDSDREGLGAFWFIVR